MFFNIKNAVQGELVDTTATESKVTDENGQPTEKPGNDQPNVVKSLQEQGTVSDNLLCCIKEADRERAMRERIDLTTIQEESEDNGCGLCSPATPPQQTGECDPNWCSDSDTVWRAHDDPWYTHGIYVLCKNSKPIEYFNYKCLALRRMRDEARDMCLLDVNYNYRVIHCSDTHIQVVRTHKWWVVAYDDIVADLTICRVYKKNNR